MTNENEEQIPTRRKGIPPLRVHVVSDTNALHTSSPLFLASKEAKDLAQGSFPDIELLWWIPTMVLRERQYQMIQAAKAHMKSARIVNQLLSQESEITEELLSTAIRSRIQAEMEQCGMRELRLDPAHVDWPRLLEDAAFRRPPFAAPPADKPDWEKGFRDAVITETFIQFTSILLDDPEVEQAILVTADAQLRDAAGTRLIAKRNVHVVASLSALKERLEILSNRVSAQFVAHYKPIAARAFFDEEKASGLYLREDIASAIMAKFEEVVDYVPEGGLLRNNRWEVGETNFISRAGPWSMWRTRVNAIVSIWAPLETTDSTPELRAGRRRRKPTYVVPKLIWSADEPTSAGLGLLSQGIDAFDVRWKAQVTSRQTLAKPRTEELTHVGLTLRD